MLKRETLTVKQAAAVLGIGRNQAYQAAREGIIPSVRVGARILIPRVALERFLNEARQGLRGSDA